MRKPLDSIVELIRATSTSLASDVTCALKKALGLEKTNPSAKVVLKTILDNVKLAEKNSTPLCQDTGTLTFFVNSALKKKASPETIREAVRIATKNGWLRKNAIDSIDGKSYDDNCANGLPVIHYLDDVKGVTLLMKGGGSENMSRQYSLPDGTLGAGRDLDGARKCILDAIDKTQGYGCAPGIIGVCIGGDRATGYETAKMQLLRNLNDFSPDKRIAALEKRILKESNSLGIGPMGLGGKTTLLGVKIASCARLPASFFVTIAYMCWALRRRTIEL